LFCLLLSPLLFSSKRRYHRRPAITGTDSINYCRPNLALPALGSCRAKKRKPWSQLQTYRLCLRVARLDLHERDTQAALTTTLRLQAAFTLTGTVCSDEVQIICHLACRSMDKPKRIWKAMLTLLIAVLEALVCTLPSAPGVWAQIQGLFHFNTYRL
jgi:hypothetical protein